MTTRSKTYPPSDDFALRITQLRGEEGIKWLAQLPSVLARCGERWALTILAPFERLSHSYVAPAIRVDGSEVVLKVSFPDTELLREVRALRFFDGRGTVRLLDADSEQGVLLLERLKPGAPLSGLEDDERATSIAAQVMRRLWRPVPEQNVFPTVAHWACGLERLRDSFAGRTGPFPAHLVEAAERLFSELISSMGQEVLLHGDLHHDNILAAEREPWLAIDPKGVVAEREYEVGALLRNPVSQLMREPRPVRMLARRVDQLVEELGFNRNRIIAWGLAQAVLAAWWSYEDQDRGWEQWIACAALLQELA